MPWSPWSILHDAPRRGCLLALLIPSVVLLAAAMSLVRAQQLAAAPNMTGRYHFLGPEDTLAVLQEGTALKGYIDVFQGETESDAVLSYPLTIGSRNGNVVSFRTRKIHEKHYRFEGTVERGIGKKPGAPDYLRLVGKLETITSNSVTGINKVDTQPVTLKSLGKGENIPD
ncbi:MAG: hypothetical protein ACRD1O_12835 [Terriglobia bacterium]